MRSRFNQQPRALDSHNTPNADRKLGLLRGVCGPQSASVGNLRRTVVVPFLNRDGLTDVGLLPGRCLGQGGDREPVLELGVEPVLRQLHDELDAAVLVAYGWEDLTAALVATPVGAASRRAGPGAATGAEDPAGTTLAPTEPGAALDQAAAVEETLLQRLVALNAERAAEERRGLIRWLRPDFQHPGGGATVQAEATMTATTPAASGPKPDWPKTLPEQFQALRTALAARPGPLNAANLAQSFTRAPRARVAELLDTLATLGHIRRLPDGRYLSS